MDGQYLVKEKSWYSSYGLCMALQNLCVERGLLPSTGDSDCWNSLSVNVIPPMSLPQSQLEVFFKHTFPSKQFSEWMYKPHIWICIGWSWSHPKVSTHQGSDFLMVFSTKRQEAAAYFACKCSVPYLNIYHEMLLELFWTMNIQHICLFEVVN